MENALHVNDYEGYNIDVLVIDCCVKKYFKIDALKRQALII